MIVCHGLEDSTFVEPSHFQEEAATFFFHHSGAHFDFATLEDEGADGANYETEDDC
jgi:hypothetical protein